MPLHLWARPWRYGSVNATASKIRVGPRIPTWPSSVGGLATSSAFWILGADVLILGWSGSHCTPHAIRMGQLWGAYSFLCLAIIPFFVATCWHGHTIRPCCHAHRHHPPRSGRRWHGSPSLSTSSPIGPAAFRQPARWSVSLLPGLELGSAMWSLSPPPSVRSCWHDDLFRGMWGGLCAPRVPGGEIDAAPASRCSF